MAGSNLLCRGGQFFGKNDRPIILSPKELGVLNALYEENGGIVSAKTLIDRVWGAQVVGPESLSRCISTLRSKLSLHQVQLINHSRRGYSLYVGGALQESNDANAPSRSSAIVSIAREYMGFRRPNNISVGLELLYRWIDDHGPDEEVFAAIVELQLVRIRRCYDAPSCVESLVRDAAKSALKLNPDNAVALAALGWLEVVVHHSSGGLAKVRRATELGPDRPLIRALMVWAAAAEGAQEKIFEAVQAYMTLAEKLPISTAAAGYILTLAGQYDEGAALIERSYRTMPWDDVGLFFKAALHADRGDFDPALELAVRATELSRNTSRPLAAHRAYFLFKVGQSEAAHEIFEKLRLFSGGIPPISALIPYILANEGPEAARLQAESAYDAGCPLLFMVKLHPQFSFLTEKLQVSRPDVDLQRQLVGHDTFHV